MPRFKTRKYLSGVIDYERLGFLGGLLTEGAGLVDLGGQFLDSGYYPPLLRQSAAAAFHSPEHAPAVWQRSSLNPCRLYLFAERRVSG